VNRIVVAALLFILSFPALAGEKGLAPHDNLVVEGIPLIPQEIIDGVGRYTEFRSASFQSWHPKKREILIITRFGDVPQVHHVKSPGGARTQLTFFSERVVGAGFNPKRDDYFAFSMDVGGGEKFQNYRYDVATGNITLLTDGKSRNSGGAWSSKGDRVVYGSMKRNGKDIDFYIIDPLDPKNERMLAQLDKGEAWSVSDWSPDDSKIIAREGVSVNESYLYLFDAATGEKTLLTPKTEGSQVYYGGGKFSKDGKGIYTVTDKDNEFNRLAFIDLATMKHTYLTSHVNWNVDGFDLTPDGKRIAFVTNEDGIGVLHVMNTATRKEEKLPRLPPGLFGGLEWHNDSKHLGFTFTTSRSPADVYSLNVATGKLERWTYSETGGLNTSTFAEPALVKWKTFDGKMISGFLYNPPVKFTGKRPIIVSIHGGPESQARPGFQARNNYYLNELGIATILPNIRGSSGYGKTFIKLDNGYLREDSYKDLGALLDWIKTQPNLDGNRIMVTGGSYGGHSTLAVATLYDDKIRCSVPVVGMSNLVTFLERTEAYRRDLRRVEYGDERDPGMREFLTRIAPMTNANNITRPMLIVQGQNDPRVPASEAEQMLATLKKNNTPVWFLMAKDEGHGFAKKKNQDYQFYTTVLFAKEFLLK